MAIDGKECNWVRRQPDEEGRPYIRCTLTTEIDNTRDNIGIKKVFMVDLELLIEKFHP